MNHAVLANGTLEQWAKKLLFIYYGEAQYKTIRNVIVDCPLQGQGATEYAVSFYHDYDDEALCMLYMYVVNGNPVKLTLHDGFKDVITLTYDNNII